MVQEITSADIIYPDSDGEPMADNTKQFRYLVTIKENLELLYADNPQVFVAGDLLWYPLEGDNKTRRAPDVMVVFGRPKGDRGSYQQWQENGIAPQVVFEILSPGNTSTEMKQKQQFYNLYGVEEYYIYDPDNNNFSVWLRGERDLEPLGKRELWVSPLLQIRFQLQREELEIYTPRGEKFLTYTELGQSKAQAEARAEQEHQRAEQERQRAETAEARIRELEAQLRQLGG